MTRDQAKILHALFTRFAMLVSFERLENVLWADRIDGGPLDTRGVLKMQISLIRRKLHGWPYVITSHYNTGYSLCRVESVVTDGGKCKARKEVRAA